MKAALKQLIPDALIQRYQRLRVGLETRANRRSTPERVFTDIYARNLWGGRPGEFHSGSGSSATAVTAPYVEAIRQLIAARHVVALRFVDLGCGDFEIGRQLTSLCRTYVGVDVVARLVEQNQLRYGSDRVSFRHIDIVQDTLPDGDVCFLRQVLQHLSNAQIAAVLPKLSRYQAVIITEHGPSPGRSWRANADKAPGHHTRLLQGSGVDVTEPPFNLPRGQVETVLEVSAPALATGADAGVIRTILYSPRGAVAAGAAGPNDR
jgi:hypothetical protein